ncbi:MAG TPA: hypothetical protein VIL51_01430, partial [Thermoleophilia bacterium]
FARYATTKEKDVGKGAGSAVLSSKPAPASAEPGFLPSVGYTVSRKTDMYSAAVDAVPGPAT